MRAPATVVGFDSHFGASHAAPGGLRAPAARNPAARHMFGQFELLPEPFGVVDGVVVDGAVCVVDDGVVVVAVLEDELPLDEPVAAFAIATTPPAIAPVASRLARIFRSLITSPPFLSSSVAGRLHFTPPACEFRVIRCRVRC